MHLLPKLHISKKKITTICKRILKPNTQSPCYSCSGDDQCWLDVLSSRHNPSSNDADFRTGRQVQRLNRLRYADHQEWGFHVTHERSRRQHPERRGRSWSTVRLRQIQGVVHLLEAWLKKDSHAIRWLLINAIRSVHSVLVKSVIGVFLLCFLHQSWHTHIQDCSSNEHIYYYIYMYRRSK